MKQKYYSLNTIKSYRAKYNVIFGERSNGKTYAVYLEGIREYVKTGKQLAIVRRWQDDYTGKRGATMFDSVVKNGEIAKATAGKWTGVYYFGSRWYLCAVDEDGNRIKDETPFAYGFSLSAMEHDKSTSYPNITTVLFDEFITRSVYLTDEFVLFMNVLSTIIRERNDVTIYMCGNTVNKYCPYFSEMGLKNVRKMTPGTIDLYRYGNSELTVAVEYVAPNKAGKKSDVYFAFNNPKLEMITGGAWEIDVYPHCPCKYKPKEILFTYFIQFGGDLLQCEIVLHDREYFTFIHRKTTPLQSPNRDLIFSLDYHSGPNRRRKINRPDDVLGERIAMFFKQGKVFYQDNEVGEIIRNYLMACGKRE